MNFADVDQRYGELKRQYAAGALPAEQFDAQLLDMMVRDDENRWWAKSRESGEWHYHDAVSGDWVRADPPGRPTAKPSPSPSSASAPAHKPAPASVHKPNWAAVVPPTAETALVPAPNAVTRAPATPATATQTPPAVPHSAHDFSPLPELGGGLKVIFYLFSFFVPVVGIVLFFVYRKKPVPQDRAAARVFLILGIASLILFGLCASILIFFEVLMANMSGF